MSLAKITLGLGLGTLALGTFLFRDQVLYGTESAPVVTRPDERARKKYLRQSRFSGNEIIYAEEVRDSLGGTSFIIFGEKESPRVRIKPFNPGAEGKAITFIAENCGEFQAQRWYFAGSDRTPTLEGEMGQTAECFRDGFQQKERGY